MSFSKDAKIHRLQDENDMLRKLWAEWEEVPDEDLWEDGELDTQAVIFKMYSNVCRLGKWKLIRRIK